MSDHDDIAPEPNATLSCRPKHEKPQLRRSKALSDTDDDVNDNCINKGESKDGHEDHHKDKKSKPKGLKKLFRSMTLGDKMRAPGQTSPNKHFENLNGAFSRRHTLMESKIKLPDDFDASPKMPKRSKLLRRSSIAEGGLGEFKWWEEESSGDELNRIDEVIPEDIVPKAPKHPKSSTGDDVETESDEDDEQSGDTHVFDERRHRTRPRNNAPGKDPRRRTKRSDSIAEGGKAVFNWWDESLDEKDEDESSGPIGPRIGRGRGRNPKSVGFLMDVLAVASVGTFSYRIYEKPTKVLDRYDFDYWFDDYGWGYGERPNDVYGPSGRKRHSRSLDHDT